MTSLVRGLARRFARLLMQQPIAILYEHPEWKPLLAELDRHGVPYVAHRTRRVHLTLAAPGVGTRLFREASTIVTRISNQTEPFGWAEALASRHEYDACISSLSVLRERRARRRGGGLHTAPALTDTAPVLQRISGMTPRRSAVWHVTFRAAYAFIRVLDPLLRWTWFSVGLGITSRLSVRGRRTGRERNVLVGLIRVGGRWYVGHPNGEVAWTRNLRSRALASVAPRPETPIDVTAAPLEHGAERDAVIMATAEQQPFPANLLYRGAQRHILSEGRYFRLEPS